MPSREERRWEHYHASSTKRAVRKQQKRNRKPKSVRRKNWNSDGLRYPDDLFLSDQTERVMPRGERERRQEALAAANVAMQQQAAPPASATSGDAPGLETGTVVEVSSGLCRVRVRGSELLCSYRGSLSVAESGFTNLVAVGDRVKLQTSGNGQGVVEEILPRSSILVRPDVFRAHLQQVIVANADRLLVVASWRDPLLWFELIDRYLVTAKRYRLDPAICVNKIDLADNEADCRRAMRPYINLGYQVLFTSAVAGEGLDELRALLRDHMTVLAGLSGVGKSSLLSAADPDLNPRVGAISDVHKEGRHVTAQVSLLPLAAGGYVVDTPGVREFGLSGLARKDLGGFFPEIANIIHGCRFSDCLHLHEPGCAVKMAVSDGAVSKVRYKSYRKILEDLPESNG